MINERSFRAERGSVKGPRNCRIDVRRPRAWEEALRGVAGDYDTVIVDCPPSLGLLTVNGLTAADSLIIPIQCEYYGLEGISQLLNTVRLVQQNFNPALAIGGVLLTMYDSRLNLCRQVAEDAKEYFGAKVFATPIPRNVRLAEAPSFGKPILLYDARSRGAEGLRHLQDPATPGNSVRHPRNRLRCGLAQTGSGLSGSTAGSAGLLPDPAGEVESSAD